MKPSNRATHRSLWYERRWNTGYRSLATIVDAEILPRAALRECCHDIPMACSDALEPKSFQPLPHVSRHPRGTPSETWQANFRFERSGLRLAAQVRYRYPPPLGPKFPLRWCSCQLHRMRVAVAAAPWEELLAFLHAYEKFSQSLHKSREVAIGLASVPAIVDRNNGRELPSPHEPVHIDAHR